MAKAIAKNIRMSPRKLRRVVDVIRGKHTNDAQVVLKFMPYAAARVVEKVLKSAIANAKENENLNIEDLKISKVFIDQSTTLKRWRAMSRGRGFPILKKTSHVTIEVSPDLTGIQKSTHKNKKNTQVKLKDKKHDHKHDHEHDHSHEHEHEHGPGCNHEHEEEKSGAKKQ